MFDFNSINNRFFEVKISTDVYRVEACSVKTLKKLNKVNINDSEALAEITQLTSEIINKNLDGNKVSVSTLEDMSFDALFGFIVSYMEWLSKVQNSPNL